MSEFDLNGYLEERRTRVDHALDRALPAEDAPPPLIHRAMRYAVFAGGKRLRPILVLAGCEAAGGDPEDALGLACAVEMIHTYSLVHDDLPALDDDDLRRGRPTVHRAFDEATAILTGDALLTLAFESALGPRAAGPPVTAPSTGNGRIRELEARERRVEALRTLVAAAGTAGMIGGQVDDLQATRAAEGPRSPAAVPLPAAADRSSVDESLVRSIHERKTGALLRACLVIGGILAGAEAAILAKLDAYGADLGLSFQIIDDILDIEGTSQTLGKSVGKDAAMGKATFPAAIGVERSRTLAVQLGRSAVDTVRDLGEGARPLAALAEFVVQRKA